MAFSRAKRFVYKSPELAPSPADYVITTTLEKGHSISKSPRFRIPVEDDEISPICSRYHSRGDVQCNTSNSEKESSNKYDDKDSVKTSKAEFNRSDINRISIRRKSLRSNEKVNESKFNTSRWGNDSARECNGANVSKFNTPQWGNDSARESNGANVSKFNTPRWGNDSARECNGANVSKFNTPRWGNDSARECNGANVSKFNTPRWENDSARERNGAKERGNIYFYQSEEFIDDDYDSFTSSEDNQHLFGMDKFEFNKSFKNQGETSLFEETVLTKLENIESNVENFKEDFAKLHQNRNVKETGADKNYLQNQICIPSSQKYEEINGIVRKAMKYLCNQFELKRKSMDKDCEEKIRKLISDMYISSEKSKKQMNALCNNTTEKLLKHINDILNSTATLEFPSVDKNIYLVDNMKENRFTRRDNFNYENVCNVLSHHLQQAKEEMELLENDEYLDITLKFADTEEMLELQGRLIGTLKDELGDLKHSLGKRSNKII